MHATPIKNLTKVAKEKATQEAKVAAKENVWLKSKLVAA